MRNTNEDHIAKSYTRHAIRIEGSRANITEQSNLQDCSSVLQ